MSLSRRWVRRSARSTSCSAASRAPRRQVPARRQHRGHRDGKPRDGGGDGNRPPRWHHRPPRWHRRPPRWRHQLPARRCQGPSRRRVPSPDDRRQPVQRRPELADGRGRSASTAAIWRRSAVSRSHSVISSSWDLTDSGAIASERRRLTRSPGVNTRRSSRSERTFAMRDRRTMTEPCGRNLRRREFAPYRRSASLTASHPGRLIRRVAGATEEGGMKRLLVRVGLCRCGRGSGTC